MYSAAANKRAAEGRVNRLNNPGAYSFDEKYVSVGQEREKERRRKAIERSINRSTFMVSVDKKINNDVQNVQISCRSGIMVL